MSTEQAYGVPLSPLGPNPGSAKEWVVSWRSTLTEHAGQGVSRFSYSECADFCTEMDKRFPDLRHCPKWAGPAA